MKKNHLIVLLAILIASTNLFSQQLSPDQLKKGRWLSQEEYDNRSNLQIRTPSEAPEGPVQPVAEFEPMQGVLIAYPFGIPMDLIVEMSEDVMVTTIVSSQSQANSVSNTYQSNGVNMDHVDFLIEPHNTYWTRDYGPWFIREEDQISIVNFTYNRPRPDDDIMPVNVANMLGIPYYDMPVIHTGGNYMNDGFGIAAQTELVYEENTMSNDQVDQYMEDYLGVTQNFVIDDPLGDYIKHIDCWAKFLDVDKVLVAEVPESDPRYDDYEYAANYFASRDCAYGYPFEVVRVYAPGNDPSTPYTNSLILNNKVFLPITGSQWDDEAIATYEEAMPGYEIVPVMDGNQDWINSDALHCRTHEIADIGMLKITHMPFHGEQSWGGEAYRIEANIFPYSGAELYADSILLNVKINDGEFISLNMFQHGEHEYAYDLFTNLGDTVYYYIHAADESGRSENLPYIGEADPFMFTVEALEEYIAFNPDTLFIPGNEFIITLTNTGNTDAMITEIFKGTTSSPLWMIESTDPEISSYPYQLLPTQTIDVNISVAVGKGIFYDSLIVTTEDGQYHGIIAGDGVGINNPGSLGSSFNLSPNPMSNNGQISLNLEEAAAVEIEIYQLNGQLIRTLESSRLSAGAYEYAWDGYNSNGNQSGAGVYLVKLQINNQLYIEKWIKM
jgi:agmatine/peptidylarginine deiminase